MLELIYCKHYAKHLMYFFPPNHLLFFFFLATHCLYSMWDLSSLTRDQTHTPCIRRLSLNHWTTRKVLNHFLLSPFYKVQKPRLGGAAWVTELSGGAGGEPKSFSGQDLHDTDANTVTLWAPKTRQLFMPCPHSVPTPTPGSRRHCTPWASEQLAWGLIPTPGGEIEFTWGCPSPSSSPLSTFWGTKGTLFLGAELVGHLQ